jgi:hypothetical protein
VFDGKVKKMLKSHFDPDRPKLPIENTQPHTTSLHNNQNTALMYHLVPTQLGKLVVSGGYKLNSHMFVFITIENCENITF